MEELHGSIYERQWRRLNGWAIICVLLFYIAITVMPGRMLLFKTTYFRAFEAVMAAFLLFFFRRKAAIELKLMFAYCAWLVITRILNHDYYLQYDIDLVLDNLLCAVLLASAATESKAEREKLLRVVLGLVLLFYTVLGVLSVLNLYLSRPILLPFEGASLGRQGGSGERFSLLYTAPTQSSMWFAYASFAALYFIEVCKKPVVRVLLVLDLVLFNCIIGLVFSYGAMFGYCVAAAMLALLIGMRRLKLKKGFLRVLLLTLITAAALPLAYFSFSLTRGAAQSLEDTIYQYRMAGSEQSAEPETAAVHTEGVAQGEPAEPKHYNQKPLYKKVSSFGNRLQIWSACFEAMTYDPSEYIIGENNLNVMYGTNYILDQRYIEEAKAEGKDAEIENTEVPIDHHNAYIQLFVLTGIPGALMVLTFLILLVRRMLICFFSPFKKAGMETKLFTLPLASMLVYSMVECGLFGNVDIRVILFFFIAGVFFADTGEPAVTERSI